MAEAGGDGPPPVPPPGDPGWRWPQSPPFTPTRMALCDRDSPQQPFFLPTPTNLFRSQATAEDKTATDEGVLREGSLCSMKAIALMLLNIKRDNIRRLTLQYESALAEITRLQDLSKDRWSLEDTVKSLPLDEATKHHVQADSLPRTLDAEFECEKTTLATDTQTSPTTAQKVLEGLGAQTTKVVDRVYDPSPTPPDQPVNLAKETTTTDTTPGQWTRGVEDVKTEKTGKSHASGHALRLSLQTPNSTVDLLSSSEAATACGAGPPEGAETPLSAARATIPRSKTPFN